MSEGQKRAATKRKRAKKQGVGGAHGGESNER